jgi:FtsZ-interacting cell division protein ZipA
MRLLVLIVLVAIIVMVFWALWRRTRDRVRAGTAGDGRYRVLETTSGTEAHVLIAGDTRESRVLVGSVPITSPDFDQRYGELILLAEDRVATLNASRQLHEGS